MGSTENTTAWISPDRRLVVDGRTVLTDVPPEVTSSADVDASAIFLGVDMAESCDRHIIPLGKLRNIRFLACFRFKLWWMTQKMGKDGKDVPWETQFLLLEIPPPSSSSSSDEEVEAVLYAALLPLFDGPFRASLRGSPDSSLLLSLESGDSTTMSHSSPRPLLLGPALSDPFAAITSAVSAARSHLGTFCQRVEKLPPPIVDLFGWCTWDAFYQDVCQEGVEDGLRSLSAGGAPPRFLIIDDGWQSVAQDGDAKVESIMRLSRAEENSKFKNGDAGIGHVVRLAKQRYGVKHVYTWHALLGYWGGVGPGFIDGCEVRYPTVPEGVDGNDGAFKKDPLVVEGVGVVNPRNVFSFYDALHGYLKKEGVDGVKVDAQSLLETIGGGLGGRVRLAKLYHEALDRSVAKHFRGAEIIACMSHSSDAIYCSKQTAVVRASDDFYPRDPISHTIHVASVAYNSIFLGEFMLPDWDMFHSLHPAAEYHASARAISGGPVYVSDKPGHHNFELLRKLVLPGGSILRARLPGRPTKDCLFADPARDNISLLKIWNMNKYTGVLGVYNCQGAAWCGTEKKNVFHKTGTDALTTNVRGDDVHLISEAAMDPNWTGDCAVYHEDCGDVIILARGASLPVSLKVLEHKIFTITPVKVLAPGFKFAPFGLLEMYNGGGAIEELSYEVVDSFVGESNGTKSSNRVGIVRIGLKGCGVFGAYSLTKPRKCSVGSKEAKFSYDPSSGLLKFNLEYMPDDPVGNNLHALVVEL